MAMREPSGLELAEDIRQLTRAIEALTKRFDDLGQTYLPREVYEAHHQALADKVARIDSRTTWIGRAAITGLAFPVLVAIIVAVIFTLGAQT